MSHLDALNLRLSHERVRLANARSEKERAQRKVWVSQIEKEIAAEERFVGDDGDELSDDELIAALTEKGTG